MCPLGRSLICEEGRILHCVIRPDLTRHGRRHPLVSAGHGDSWRSSLPNCVMYSVADFGRGRISS
jgi:hypothetical protein